MKQNIHHLYYLFYPRSWIIIALLLLFSAIITAQESTPSEFVLDASINKYENLFIDTLYNSFIQCGFNAMTQRATIDSKPLLEDFNLHAINMRNKTDWIYYYSSSYYSKWEAEEDQPCWNKVGVKHSVGDTATWRSELCWSTKGVLGPVDTLVYGPTYHRRSFTEGGYMIVLISMI
jgi:hypothetical protein